MLGVGVVVFLISHYRDSDTPAAKAPLPAASAADPQANASAPTNITLDKEARTVAAKFILTAVARNNTGASWELLDPTFFGKNEYTKKTWAKGDIPVIPTSFPLTNLEQARFNVTYNAPDQKTVEVLLVPRSGKGEPELFEIGLRRRGEGASQRWLVDYWMTRYRAGRLPNPQ